MTIDELRRAAEDAPYPNSVVHLRRDKLAALLDAVDAGREMRSRLDRFCSPRCSCRRCAEIRDFDKALKKLDGPTTAGG